MAANRLDFGNVGNSPVVAGQAADIPFKEIALAGRWPEKEFYFSSKRQPYKIIEGFKREKSWSR